MINFSKIFYGKISSNPYYFWIFIIGPIIILFLPLLWGKVFFGGGGDLTHASYPALEFFKTHYLSGLNPHLYLGFPLASSFQYAYFNPAYLLIFKIFDYLTAYHLILFIDLLLTAIFSYLLFSNLFSNKSSSVLATVVYVFNQSSLFRLLGSTIANGLFILPAIYWLIIKISAGRYWYTIGLALVFGYAFLSAHYQFIVMAFVGGLFFLFYQIWIQFDSNKLVWKNFYPVAYYFIGLLGGFLIGAPQILNLYRFFGYTTRSVTINYTYLKGFDLFKYLLPNLNIQQLTNQEFLPFIGIAPLFLVVIAFIFVLNKKNNLAIMSASGFILFFSLIFKYSPTSFILRHLPVFRYFAEPGRWLYVANLFLAILVALGLDFILKEKDSDLFQRILFYLKKITIVIFVLFFIVNILFYLLRDIIISVVQNYFDLNLYEGTSHLPIDFYHQLIVTLIDKLFSNFSLINLNVVLFLVTSGVLYLILKKYHSKQYLGYILIGLTIINLLASFFINISFFGRSQALSRPQFVEIINQRENNTNNFRVFSYLVGQAQYQKISALHPEASKEVELFSQEGLIGNINDFSLLGGVEGNIDRKVQQIIFLYLNNQDNSFTDKISLLSVLNTKYIVTPYEINDKNIDLISNISVTKFKVPLYLYENRKVLPRIFLAKDVNYLSENNDQINLKTILDPINDFSQTTFIECNNCQPTSNEMIDSVDNLEIQAYHDEDIKIKWPLTEQILSNKDKLGVTLRQYRENPVFS